MELCLVVQENMRWYCSPEQAEYWAAQGCTVFELTPTRVAGPEVDIEADRAETLSAEASTGQMAEDEETALVPPTAQGGSDE